jgi:hypothetical protein
LTLASIVAGALGYVPGQPECSIMKYVPSQPRDHGRQLPMTLPHLHWFSQRGEGKYQGAIMRILRCLVGIILTCLALMLPAAASLRVCNKYSRTVHLALAFEQLDRSFVSQGWLQANPGACETVNLIAVPKYYRLETDDWTRGQQTLRRDWPQTRMGSGLIQFYITYDTFRFTNAEAPRSRARKEDFYKFASPGGLLMGPSMITLEVSDSGVTERIPR